MKKVLDNIYFGVHYKLNQLQDIQMKDNSTGKNKDFYSRGKQMFDRIQPLKPPIQEDIDLLYAANSADIEALEDARMTLNVIKEMEPTFAGIINSSLSLIDKALGMSYGDAMERVAKRAGGKV